VENPNKIRKKDREEKEEKEMVVKNKMKMIQTIRRIMGGETGMDGDGLKSM
jgi:hypothetical protein